MGRTPGRSSSSSSRTWFAARLAVAANTQPSLHARVRVHASSELYLGTFHARVFLNAVARFGNQRRKLLLDPGRRFEQ